MLNKVKLYGNSPALFYLGSRLIERSFDVECYCPSLRADIGQLRVRPVRLSTVASHQIQNLYRSYRRPYFFLENAPRLKTWGLLGQSVQAGSFDGFESLDRRVEHGVLLQDLRECFESAGGVVHEVDSPVFPAGKNSHEVEVLDLSPETLQREERKSHFPHALPRRKYQVAELRLEAQRDDDELSADLEFLKIENSLVFSEKINSERVLSVFSASRYGRERVLKALLDPKADVPTKWKALILRSSGMKQQQFSVQRGPSGFYRPGVWALGETVGALSPLGNMQTNYSIEMAHRLFETISGLSRRNSPLMEAEDWRQQERAELEKMLRKGRFMENMLFKDSWGRETKSQLVGLLPSRLRQKLASPV